VRAKIRYGVVYIAILSVLIGALISIHPTFYFVLSGFFSQTFYALPPVWAIPFVSGATVLLGIAGLEERSFPAILAQQPFWLWVLGGLSGSLIALWLDAIINQSAERRVLIDELHRAQESLAQVEREAGVLQERQRLSREIHDTLAQGLISIITHLQAAEQSLEAGDRASGDETLLHHLAQAQRMARANLGEARRVVQDLRPELLEATTLPSALRGVVAAWAESSGTEASARLTGTVRFLPVKLETTLLRVVQEALANIAKHANARTASVTLSYMPDRIMLDVQDDGDGLVDTAPVSLSSTGFGLQSMRERVAELGGTLHIESEPGAGTILVAAIPYASKRDLPLVRTEEQP
jgi:signal transduction histidine kinase